MRNTFDEYEEYRRKVKENNPVLQEGGLTIYLRNHPEKGLNNRLKAYKEKRVGFGFMHKKFEESLKDLDGKAGNLGIPYSSRNKKDSSVSKISLDLFANLAIIFKSFGYHKIYYGENEYVISTKEFGDIKSYRRLDFYCEELNLGIEFQGDYWHKRDLSKYSEDEVKESIDNDYLKYKSIKLAIPGITIKYIYENEYRNNPQIIIDEITEYLGMIDQTGMGGSFFGIFLGGNCTSCF